MARATGTDIPALLLKKHLTVTDLAAALKLSRYQTYGLVRPGRYPVPADLFDVRGTLASRVAEAAGVSMDDVWKFYGKAAA